MSWVVFFVLIVAIFVGIPKVMDKIDPTTGRARLGHVDSASQALQPDPKPVPAEAEVTNVSTYPTNELHNMRASVTVRNTGTETHSYHITLETTSTHTIVSVWDVPAGGVGSNDAYLSTKDRGRFVVGRVPDPPLEVVKIVQF